MIKIFKTVDRKTLFFISIILLVGIFIRFYNIEKIPPFVPHDELGYFINAQALQISGTDITGMWNPLSLTPVTPTLAELTTHIIAPFYWLPISPILAGKLPFLLMSLILPFLIAGISYEFSRSKYVALFAYIFTMFNPWIWQIGRMPFDGYSSFFFYNFGAYVLLKLHHWKKLWAIPLLFIGFYQYQGHKIVFLLWVLAFFFYSIRTNLHLNSNMVANIKKIDSKSIVPQLIVMFFSITLFAFYLFVQLPSHKSKDRLNSLFTPNSIEIVEMVNEQRRLSFDSPLNKIFINKYSIWTGRIFERLTQTYGFQFLFLEGQVVNSSWSVWNHGIFYIIDSILIIFGFSYLLISKRYKFILFLGIFLSVLVIPSLISSDKSYFFRSSLNISLLIFLCALGAECIRKKFPLWIKIIFILIYVLSILHFGYLYFVRYPVLASDRQFFSDRVLAEYLKRVPESQKVVVFSPEPEFTITTHVFFNSLLNKHTIGKIQSAYTTQNFIFNNIEFTGNCLPANPSNFNELVISRHDIRNCGVDEAHVLTQKLESDTQDSSNPLQIQAIKDSGKYFTIYNDQVCAGLEINPYLRIYKQEQFDFESMNDKEFCQTWLSKSLEN